VQFSRILATFNRYSRQKSTSILHQPSTHLLIVVLSQLLQLLTFVVFNAVQHRVDLSRFRLRPVVAVAKRTAIHADEFDDAKANEDLADDLENEREEQEAQRANSTSDEAVDLDVVEEGWVDEESERRQEGN
jgi:hypothetical protein